MSFSSSSSSSSLSSSPPSSSRQTLDSLSSEAVKKTKILHSSCDIPNKRKFEELRKSIVTYHANKCFYNYQSQPWDEEGHMKMHEDMSKAENYDAATRKYWSRIQDETNYNKIYFNQYKNVQNTNKRFKNYSKNNKQLINAISVKNGISEPNPEITNEENKQVVSENEEKEYTGLQVATTIIPTRTGSDNYSGNEEAMEDRTSDTSQNQEFVISPFFEEQRKENPQVLQETRIDIDNLEKNDFQKDFKKNEDENNFQLLQLADEERKENIEPEIDENTNQANYSERKDDQELLMFYSDDSVADPDFDDRSSSNEESSSDSDQTSRKKNDIISQTEESIEVKKGKKRKRDMDRWVTLSSKKLRNTEDERTIIFNNYWQMGDLHRQRDFIAASMIKVEPKYRYVKEGSCRKANNAFFFEKDGKRLRVCKVFFMNTLDINHRVIRTVVEKKLNFSTSIVSEDLRGKHNNHKQIDEQIKNGARQHIRSIPKIPSHYCRADSQRDYIDGSKTIAQIYRDYVNERSQRNEQHVNYVMFYRIFTEEFNLSFFTPKKDQCEQCVGYQNALNKDKDDLKESYDRHLVEKDLARKDKKIDKEESSCSTIVTCFDLQAVFQCPKGDISVFYYKSKFLNLTFYELKTNDVTCFVWHEGEAERGVNEIGSCVLRYIEEKALSTEEELEFIFYTDNCSGQQKNKFMIHLYQYAIQEFANIKSITHKFLIKGHTQNEGDSAHSMIEREVKRVLKSGPIYTPDNFISIIRSAKKTGRPYKVIEMTHENFYNIKGLTGSGQESFKNKDKETVKTSEIKVMKMTREAPCSFFYKTSYMEEELKEVDTQSKKKSLRGTSKNNDRLILQPAYSKKRSLPENKKKDLLDLIKHNHIPKFYAHFYNDL
ncbi:unnamed protein product [Ceutorhynchus assimilis]|uniref:DUF7869 domain-containing protein n=1 Tax=Ceutorhynchus assimilis TaxID=467358 RepID=A0A9N9MZ87_9CUCU|nr:unnamed protein product [Ceutorhynchus assimilis]